MIFTDPMLWRIVWKEYRVQRSFWLVIACSAIGLMLLVTWIVEPGQARRAAPWLIALGLPIFFALGSACVAFAAETEEDTVDLLRILAAQVNRVYLGKVSFSAAATAAMLAVLLGAARIVTWGIAVPDIGARTVPATLISVLAFAAQLLAWGFVFSLLCRKVLTAVCLTGIISPLATTLCFALAENALVTGDRTLTPDITYLLFVPPLLAISYLLTTRLMSGAAWEVAWPGQRLKAAELIQVKVPNTRMATEALERMAAVRETAPAWRRTLTRLVWLEFRNMASAGAALWAAGLLLLAFLPLPNIPWPDPFRSLGGLCAGSLLIGVWTFQSEGGQRTRFLADHGQSPAAVWLSKQLIAGLLALVMTVPFWLAIVVGIQRDQRAFESGYTSASSSVFHSQIPGASALVFSAVMACLSFAAGQFASMLIRRAIAAAFVGGVIVALLAPCTWLAVELRIPLAISAVPVILILMATTLAWSRRWLLEQATPQAWRRLAAALVASLAAGWGIIGLFRVYEVPQPEFLEIIAAERDARGGPITPQEAETATQYRQALSRLTTDALGRAPGRAMSGSPAPASWDEARAEERNWLVENQEVLRLSLATTERSACAFNDPLRPLWAGGQNQWPESDVTPLATLMLLSARELESKGLLDESLDRYMAVLRLARHVAGRGTVWHWELGMSIERRVSEWMPAWATHPEQSSERLEAAARRVAQETAQFPTLRDALLIQQFMIRRTTQNEWAEVLAKQQPGKDREILTLVTLIDRCFPWEGVRTQRVLDLFCASQLHSLKVLEQALAVPGRDVQQFASAAAAVSRPIRHRDMHNASSARDPGKEEDVLFAGQAAPQTERIPWNWVDTTFLLDSLLPPDHSRIWQARLQRELSLRVLFLRLKLGAFKKANGEYPDQLQVFGLDAIDPYTGTEFGYRPRGYHVPVYVVNGLTFDVERVQPHTPIVWSAGPGNVRIFAAMAAGEGKEHEKASQSLNALNSPLAFPLP